VCIAHVSQDRALEDLENDEDDLLFSTVTQNDVMQSLKSVWSHGLTNQKMMGLAVGHGGDEIASDEETVDVEAARQRRHRRSRIVVWLIASGSRNEEFLVVVRQIVQCHPAQSPFSAWIGRHWTAMRLWTL
jgi:hypothetical protein